MSRQKERPSASAVKPKPSATVAAKSIPGIDEFINAWHERAPLPWDIHNADPVARMVCVLLSDWSLATTGEIVHVDGGFHAISLDRRASDE